VLCVIRKISFFIGCLKLKEETFDFYLSTSPYTFHYISRERECIVFVVDTLLFICL